MNIKDAYVHVGPSGTNEKALLKDFAITAALITLTRAILNDAGTGDKTETITIPTWNQSTTGNAATASALSVIKSTAATAHYLTFVDSNNDSAANENFYTTANISITPSTGTLKLIDTTAPALIINNTNSATNHDCGILFLRSSTVKGWVGYRADHGMYLYNSTRLKYLEYKDNGTLLFETNKVWHAGNDGTGSGLDADLLDGQHLSDLDTRYVLKAGDTMTGALVVPSLSVTGAATFSQAINGSILGNAATASRLLNARTISLTGNVTGSASFDGSGNISISTTVNGGNADTVDNEHASAFAHREAVNNFVHSSNEITMVGSEYSGALFYNYRTTGGTNGNITQYNFCNGAGTVLGSISNGQFSGNAASATKLATSKTIWGQSFDGSANISGSMTGVTSINNTIYNIISVSTAGAGLKISEINQTTNAIDLSVVDFSGGADSVRSLSLQSNGSTGKVGIGTTNPSHKLHTVGDTYSSTYVEAGTYLKSGTYTQATSYILAGTYVTAGSYINATTYVRASGDDLYIGSASGSQCHQQYDNTNKVLKFIFD